MECVTPIANGEYYDKTYREGDSCVAKEWRCVARREQGTLLQKTLPEAQTKRCTEQSEGGGRTTAQMRIRATRHSIKRCQLVIVFRKNMYNDILFVFS